MQNNSACETYQSLSEACIQLKAAGHDLPPLVNLSSFTRKLASNIAVSVCKTTNVYICCKHKKTAP